MRAHSHPEQYTPADLNSCDLSQTNESGKINSHSSSDICANAQAFNPFPRESLFSDEFQPELSQPFYPVELQPSDGIEKLKQRVELNPDLPLSVVMMKVNECCRDQTMSRWIQTKLEGNYPQA